MFYLHVRTTSLNQQQQTYVTVFTTELLAHYLHIKCLSVTKCQKRNDTTNSQSSTFELQSYEKCITDVQQMFIADVLLWKSVNGYYGHRTVCNQQCRRWHYPNKFSADSMSYLIKLLLHLAVEHLTTFRQLEAQEFSSVAEIVTRDFEALFAYKRGNYQKCLQLSTQNLHKLEYRQPSYYFTMSAFPEFIQLLDDDVSLTAMTLIVNPKCRRLSGYVRISQLTLSLYLMTQCQLKLHHSMTSLARTLDYIKIAHKRHPVDWTIDRLILKMIGHKALIYVEQLFMSEVIN